MKSCIILEARADCGENRPASMVEKALAGSQSDGELRGVRLITCPSDTQWQFADNVRRIRSLDFHPGPGIHGWALFLHMDS